MYFYLSPRDWFFIFIAMVLSCYIHLASAKTHSSISTASSRISVFK